MSSISIESIESYQISNETIDCYNNLDFALARSEMKQKYEEYEEHLMSSTQKLYLEEITKTLGSPNSEKVIGKALSMATEQAIQFDLIIQNQLDSKIKTLYQAAELKIQTLKQGAELKMKALEQGAILNMKALEQGAELKIKIAKEKAELKIQIEKDTAELKIKIAQDRVEAEQKFIEEAIKRSDEKCNNSIKVIKEQNIKDLLNMNTKFVNLIEGINGLKKKLKKFFKSLQKRLILHLLVNN